MKRRTSRLISGLPALCLALALLPGTAIWGLRENVTWSYSNGTLFIQGKGPMYDYGLTKDGLQNAII